VLRVCECVRVCPKKKTKFSYCKVLVTTSLLEGCFVDLEKGVIQVVISCRQCKNGETIVF
jgi:hypothetical protein